MVNPLDPRQDRSEDARLHHLSKRFAIGAAAATIAT
jgi:hypothetical protein